MKDIEEKGLTYNEIVKELAKYRSTPELNYNQIRDDTNNSENIHEYITKNAELARKVMYDEAYYSQDNLFQKGSLPILCINSFVTIDGIDNLPKSDDCFTVDFLKNKSDYLEKAKGN